MERGTITGLCTVVGEGTSVKVTLEKELKELREQTRQRQLGEEYSTWREQQKQMSRGGRMLGDLRTIKEADVAGMEESRGREVGDEITA